LKRGRLGRPRQSGGAPPDRARPVFDDGRDMAGALEDAEEAAHGARLAALQHRTRLDPDLLDHQVVSDQVEVVLRVRLCRADHLGDVTCRRLGHEGAGDQRFGHGQVAQRLRDEPHLAR